DTLPSQRPSFSPPKQLATNDDVAPIPTVESSKPTQASPEKPAVETTRNAEKPALVLTPVVEPPALPPRVSPEKPKPASPPRSSPPLFDDISTMPAKPSSPKRASPTSHRASFLNDEQTIVPAFMTHQLEQSHEQVSSLTAQLTTATSSLTALQVTHDEVSPIAVKVVAKLATEGQQRQTLTSECDVLRRQEVALMERATRAEADAARATEQLVALVQEKQGWSQERSVLHLQTSELPGLQALVKELQLENATLRGQLSAAQTSLAACQRDLVKEQSLHAQSTERFQRLQHDREQEMLHQQRWQAEEQRHAEKEALERLLTQVRAAVSGLKVLQENVVGGKSEMEMRAMGESETRARVLLDMEGSCKAFMNRSQEECHRLQALLGTMETTMRSLRGEHMEEKERLRLEQSRLDELALHFQSQTTLLQERTDTNTRVVTQTLSAYIQDIRVAEARLHTRRERLLEEERQLHFARAAFAAQQEEALRDQRLAQERLHDEQKRVEDKLHRVRQDTAAFELLVTGYATEMEDVTLQRKLWNEYMLEPLIYN
ncbi:hypothetical protein As57867_017747, partial [Aphanomyces stellatus]